MTAPDDLVERLRAMAKHGEKMVGYATLGDELYAEAAAELTRLQGRVAELHDNGTRLREAADGWKAEAQRNQRLVAELEAENARLQNDKRTTSRPGWQTCPSCGASSTCGNCNAWRLNPAGSAK